MDCGLLAPGPSTAAALVDTCPPSAKTHCGVGVKKKALTLPPPLETYNALLCIYT